jgi:hypothetical protein
VLDLSVSECQLDGLVLGQPREILGGLGRSGRGQDEREGRECGDDG